MPDEEMPEVSLNDEEQSPETHSTRLEQIKKRLLAFRPEKIFPVSLRNKLRGLDRVISSALIVLFASGIGYGAIIVDHHPSQPKQHFSAPVTPFLIQNTSPTQGESDLQTVNKIVIDFNKAIDPVKLNGDFWIFPVVKGTFTQTQSNEAIFTPDTPLLEGTAYNIMIHGEFKSLSGSALGADYHFNFTTATPSQSVIFSANNVRQTVGSVQVGKDENYSFSVGSSVDPSGEINVYKADQSALIDSLQSDANQLGGNSTDGVFVNPLIDTSNMTLVQSQKGLADGDTLKVNLPIGVYAIVASASGAQVGNTWLVVTDLGVALRQDDQQVVVAVSS